PDCLYWAVRFLIQGYGAGPACPPPTGLVCFSKQARRRAFLPPREARHGRCGAFCTDRQGLKKENADVQSAFSLFQAGTESPDKCRLCLPGASPRNKVQALPARRTRVGESCGKDSRKTSGACPRIRKQALPADDEKLLKSAAKN
ncbi:MAG: hypothetical protein MJ102_07685, partial [Clostridia bacterium]|nr:hypothetical protein [Clostridia bacterium]